MKITTQPTPNFQANLHITPEALKVAQNSFDNLASKPNFSIRSLFKFHKQGPAAYEMYGSSGLNLLATDVFNMKRNAKTSFDVLKNVFETQTKVLPGDVYIKSGLDNKSLFYSMLPKDFHYIYGEDSDGLSLSIHLNWLGGESDSVENADNILPYNYRSIEPMYRNLIKNVAKLTQNAFGHSMFERYLELK